MTRLTPLIFILVAWPAAQAEVLRFSPAGEDAPLLDQRGKPVKADTDAVRRAYGTAFRVLADGVDVCSVDYTWKLGLGGDHPVLQPVCQDLSDYEGAAVEPGFLALDPKLGRYKFSEGHRLPDGQNARFVKRIEMGNLDPWCLEVRDGFVYTAQEEETRGLQVVDARDPKRPKYAGSVPMSGFPFFMLLGKSHAYITGGGLIGVADVTDPLDPKYIKSMPGLASMKGRFANDKLFFAGGGRGVVVYSVADPDDPELEEIIPIGKPFDLETVDGQTLYLLEDGPAPPKGKPWQSSVLRVVGREKDGRWRELGSLRGFARFGQSAGSSQGGCHRVRYANGHVYFADTAGLHCVDVRDPNQPKLTDTLELLKFKDEYYGLGMGALDLCVQGSRLFVAAGHSHPKIRANADYPPFKRRKEEDWPEREFVGGVYILDISQPGKIQQAAVIDEAQMGMHTVTNVAVEGDTLYATSRIMGLATYDISDLKNIKRLGRISLAGEVEYARVLGDKLMAQGNGLYVCSAFPAEEAEILGFCWTDTWLFGDMLFGKPSSPYVWFHNLHGDGMRLLNVANPSRPYVAEYFVPPFTWAAWVGDHLYATKAGHRSWQAYAEQQKIPIQPAARRDGEITSGLVIYDVRKPMDPRPVAQISTEAPLTRMEMRDDLVYALGAIDRKGQVVYIFNVGNPKEPRVVGKWYGDYVDGGLMGSWRMFLYRDRLFLPMSKGQGVRILDVSDPIRPRLKGVLRHHDRTISVNSLMSANTFHVAGDRLFIADYWHGVHVFDISSLDRPRYLETIKSPDRKFSGWSYGTSVSGYGRYIYKTAFGGVDIYEVNVPPDRPRGKIEGVMRNP